LNDADKIAANPELYSKTELFQAFFLLDRYTNNWRQTDKGEARIKAAQAIWDYFGTKEFRS